MSLAAVIKALHDAGIRPTGRELAEAVWLAQHLATPVAVEYPSDEPPAAHDDGPTATPTSATPSESVPIGANIPLDLGSAVRGYPVRAPDPPGLRRRQDIQRALRPLRRRVPSRRDGVLDEEATAVNIASTGVWSPVLRPRRERWFDVVIAVDTSPSMDLWRPLVTDLRAAFSQTGAFRDVRIWRLTPQSHGCTIEPGLGTHARSPRELIDGTRRRLFLVLTDGAAQAWHDGSASSTLAAWGQTGPVAVLQPLPEEMWTRTGLAALPARLSANAPGMPNSQLRVAYRRRQATGTPIPVLGIEPTALRSWAGLVAGSAFEVALAVTPAGSERPTPSSLTVARDRRTAMDRFRATASPEAYQLAVCLSAVSLTLPIMRLVQHVAVPASNVSALAEVVLGGLVSRTGDDTYEFLPGIRESLLGELRRSEAGIVLSAVSHYVAEHAGMAGRTFPAIAGRADGPVVADARAFGWIPPAVAFRLGLPAVRTQDLEDQATAEPSPATSDVQDVTGRELVGSPEQSKPYVTPGAPIDPSRVAEVLVVASAGRWLRGSGYQVTQQSVITSAGVVSHAKQIRLRFDADQPGEWTVPATTAWIDPVSDLAVLRFDPPSDAPRVSPARYARIADHGGAVSVTTIGFPRWKSRTHPDGQIYRDSAHLIGTLAVLSNRRSGTLELNFPPPSEDLDPTVSPWEGMAGAPVWCEDRIIGLITGHHRSEGLSRLTATRIDRSLAAAGSTQLAALLGIPDDGAVDTIPRVDIRLCMAADVSGYSRQPYEAAERTQRRLVSTMAEARRHAGLDESAVNRQNMGDGQFVVFPAGMDDSRVIPLLLEGLRQALYEINRDLGEHGRLRLRVALHRGRLKQADNGWVGTAAIAVHRLLDAPAARAALREHPEADFVLVVPDELYQDVILQWPAAPRPEEFGETTVDLPDKGFVEHAWLYVPGRSLAVSYRQVVRAGEASTIEEQVAADTARVLSREHPDQVTRENSMFEGDAAHEGQVVMPFYIICDVSGSMYNDMVALNTGLAQMQQQIIADPVVDDVVMLSVITFNHQARTVVPLAAPTEITLPQLAAGGGTVYSTAFREFRRAFEADRRRLKSQGRRLFRPCIFFLSDGEPNDRDYLQTFQSLFGYDPTMKQGNAAYPYVTTFGFRDAAQHTMAAIAYPNFGEASKHGRWFIAKHGQAVDQLLKSMASAIGQSVLKSGQSIGTGALAYVAPIAVDGMEGSLV